MNKNELLEQIYKSQQLKDCLQKIDADLREDVMQHAFLTLLEKDEAFIVDLHDRGKLRSYVVRVIYNLVKWSRSTYNKTKLKELLPGDLPDQILEVDEENDPLPLDQLYWYDAKMIELYAEHKSYRKIEALTGIDHKSIFYTVRKARIKIKKLIK